MNMHHFPEDVRCQHFGGTLVGEARLYYISLGPKDSNGDGLHNLFCRQYSKIGHTEEA